MLKQILTFSMALWLCACAGTQVKQIPPQVRALAQVDFFAAGHTQAAFKVTGTMDGLQTDGVVTAKKISETDVQVVLLVGGLYKVLDAIVSPQGVAYRYLFKDADNAWVRGRITQLLDLLAGHLGMYAGVSTQKGRTRVFYKGPRAKTILTYEPDGTYPVSARTVTTLNSAELTYGDYMPATAEGTLQLPHDLVYQDGNIRLEMQLISLR